MDWLIKCFTGYSRRNERLELQFIELEWDFWSNRPIDLVILSKLQSLSNQRQAIRARNRGFFGISWLRD